MPLDSRARARRFIKTQSGVVASACHQCLIKVLAFADQPHAFLQSLGMVCTPHSYLLGDVICKQDELMREVIIVASGEVRLICEMPRRPHCTLQYNSTEFMPSTAESFSAERADEAACDKFPHVKSAVREYRRLKGNVRAAPATQGRTGAQEASQSRGLDPEVLSFPHLSCIPNLLAT